jgi:hypothetical protein
MATRLLLNHDFVPIDFSFSLRSPHQPRTPYPVSFSYNVGKSLSILSDLLGSRKSVDETTPDRLIRDDILVEDLTPRPNDPIEPSQPPDRDLEQAIALLEHYSFDIEGSSARGFAIYWAGDLPSEWLRLAVLEALYQGRYKAVSVSQILALWERKQRPQTHFNEEFERLICDRLFSEVEAKNQQGDTDVEPESETNAPPIADLVTTSVFRDSATPIQLIDLTPVADAVSPPDSSPQNTTETPPLEPQRSHPTQIAQFVPEGESHVYDKLRDLALTANIQDIDRQEKNEV